MEPPGRFFSLAVVARFANKGLVRKAGVPASFPSPGALEVIASDGALGSGALTEVFAGPWGTVKSVGVMTLDPGVKVVLSAAIFYSLNRFRLSLTCQTG